jgi:hypothetical protein
MPLVINKIDNFQTRVAQSYVNLTRYNSSLYPATSVISIDRPEWDSGAEALTAVNIYDQYALRVVTNVAPLYNVTP